MCGIYASIGFAPDPNRIDRVAHRGPDGRGWQQFYVTSRIDRIGPSSRERHAQRDPPSRFYPVALVNLGIWGERFGVSI
jgi:hypothetical protein